jgi:hypothetical protein
VLSDASQLFQGSQVVGMIWLTKRNTERRSMNKIIRDYYKVTIQTDPQDSPRYTSLLAIDVAKERCKVECVPCQWDAELIAGEVGKGEVTYKVRRTRHKTNGGKDQ